METRDTNYWKSTIECLFIKCFKRIFLLQMLSEICRFKNVYLKMVAHLYVGPKMKIYIFFSYHDKHKKNCSFLILRRLTICQRIFVPGLLFPSSSTVSLTRWPWCGHVCFLFSVSSLFLELLLSLTKRFLSWCVQNSAVQFSKYWLSRSEEVWFYSARL